jgi:hypothetical protein
MPCACNHVSPEVCPDVPWCALYAVNSSVTAPLALAAGASGVGVGSAVNKLNSDIAMIAAVRQVFCRTPASVCLRLPLRV